MQFETAKLKAHCRMTAAGRGNTHPNPLRLASRWGLSRLRRYFTVRVLAKIGQTQTTSKPHDVVAAVDVEGLAGYPASGVTGEEHGGRGDLTHIHIAPQGSPFGLLLQHLAKAGDATRGKGLDWTGRDG